VEKIKYVVAGVLGVVAAFITATQFHPAMYLSAEPVEIVKPTLRETLEVAVLIAAAALAAFLTLPKKEEVDDK